jgi:hypothetical protein
VKVTAVPTRVAPTLLPTEMIAASRCEFMGWDTILQRDMVVTIYQKIWNFEMLLGAASKKLQWHE